ncbi:MAG: hypothetical protein K2X35_23835 [Bryobacteraceae bacterium]|nr:hypothetical protein [Bryobacteraceae bacterium]
MPQFRVWGVTPHEQQLPYPCDEVLPFGSDAYFRGVSCQAPAEVIFLWLCQLRVAPYSYDWIDNWGRRSPRKLTAGAQNLQPGQAVMTIFRLVSFAPGEHLTIRITEPAAKVFGEVAVTYRVFPGRLVAKLRVQYPTGWYGTILRGLLPFGDWIMMRKQLRTLAGLAETSPGKL